MKNDKLSKILFIFFYVLAMISFVLNIVLGCALMVERDKAYADYINDIVAQQNVVVNFNQLINYDNLSSSNICNKQNDFYYINGNVSDEVWAGIGISSGYINGHIYYLHIAQENSNLVQFVIDNSNLRGFSDTVVTLTGYSNDATIYLRCLANSYVNYKVQFYVIDLTLMFGEGNEPNLRQCDGLFTSQYYSYNTGTAINFNSLDSWAQGYADAIGSRELTFSGSLLLSNIGVETGNTQVSESVNGFYIENNTNMSYNAFYFIFPTSLNEGDIVTLNVSEIECTTNPSGSGTTPAEDFNVQIGYYFNGNFVTLAQFNKANSNRVIGPYTYEGGWRYNAFDLSVSFKAPANLSLLYFRYTDRIYYRDIKIEAQSTNFAFALQQAQDRGYEIAKKYYTEGEGYRQITLEAFNEGVQSSQSNVSVFQDTWSFIATAFSSVGEMLSIQIFPNVPLGVFIALPLLLGLILFIIKITKG